MADAGTMPWWKRKTVISLIVANTVPMFGVLFFGWNVLDVFLGYWAETAVLLFFTLLKGMRGRKINFFQRYVLFVAVAGPIGAFMSGHLLFIFTMLGDYSSDTFPWKIGSIFSYPSFWMILTPLFISHAISYKKNFLDGREYLNETGPSPLIAIFKRIGVMHSVLLVGGLAVKLSGHKTLALLFLFLVKIFFDIRAHLREHGILPKLR